MNRGIWIGVVALALLGVGVSTGFSAVADPESQPLTFGDPVFIGVVLDSSTLTAVDGFEYAIRVSDVTGQGVAMGWVKFDYAATEDAIDAMAEDAGQDPLYLFYDDSDGPQAKSYQLSGDLATIQVGDLSGSGDKYNPNERKSLGVCVLDVDWSHVDDIEGWYSLTWLAGEFIGSSEALEVSYYEFYLPEPMSISLLAIGGLAALFRRPRRRHG